MSNPKSADPSLWWDPFSSLLSELENAPLSSDLPAYLAEKLKENHAWFVDTVSLFKPPNAKSRELLNSPQMKIGSHDLNIKTELKDKALQISSYLNLDEVQSYILMERSFESNSLAVDSVVEEYLHLVLLHYYIERQCLLKCTRQVLTHALYVGISSKRENIIRDEARKLISDGLEWKLISVLQELLSSHHPKELDLDLFTLWAEETLIEDNLVLDILFLVYYESLCTCNGETWKKLCLIYKGTLSGSYNFGMLEISSEAMKSSYHAKVQLLFILMETLDLENLLQLVHDGIPFRAGASIFSMSDIQQMDALVSSFNAFEMKEAGSLMLTWAAFLCLISSLPRKDDNNLLTEIDHAGYLRQAFESASLNYFFEILDSTLLKESDGPVTGYRSVLRTFVSAFIASYEVNIQLEDSTSKLILDILCKIYQGEESLCNQFWDRESFIDGPIRCLLCTLANEFPLRTTELLRLLSSLSEGCWPAECVYNFLDKSVGISSSFEITSESLVDSISQIVETHLPLHLPGVEGLVIPAKTRGHVLKIINGNTAIVRWEYSQSGVLILLLRLAHMLYLENSEEVFLSLDLLSRLTSFNTGVVFSLMKIGNLFNYQGAEIKGQTERNLWVVEIICAIVKNLSPTPGSAAVMSMGVRILSKILKCAPSHVAAVALRTNIFATTKAKTFDVGSDGLSSGSWLLSGPLAKMLLIDAEQNEYENPLAISVLEFTIQLLEARVESDFVVSLVIFSLRYILINHEYWKYKVKHIRWKVTLKVFELMKTCMMSIWFSENFGMAIRDILLSDSSIHSVLFRLVCTTKCTLENLYISRLIELVEIEGFQLAISSALDILCTMLSKFSEDISDGLPVFQQAVLSSSTKPIPVVAAVISLMSYSRNSAIQVGATKVLSTLLIMADYFQPFLSSNICLGLDDEEIADLRNSVDYALSDRIEWNEGLFIEVVNMLTAAARHQPAFLVAILAPKVGPEVPSTNAGDVKQPASATSNGPQKSSLLNTLMHYVDRADDFFNSNPQILFCVLNFLKAMWHGAVSYINILEQLENSSVFWKQLSNCISLSTKSKTSLLENITEMEAQSLTYKYCCQFSVLEIMAYEMFLKKKLLHVESLSSDAPLSKDIMGNSVNNEKSKYTSDTGLKDILSSWFDMSILEKLIKSYTYCEYDDGICYHAEVAASLFIVHAMRMIESGNTGSLSLSLLGRIQIAFENVSCQPAFSELLAQYSQRGYHSEGKELKSLILNDLYYHLEGELVGRKIGPGPFKELALYLVDLKLSQMYKKRYIDAHLADAKNIYLYDLAHVQTELGIHMWDYTEWEEHKGIAEKMLNCMQQVNSMVLLTSSKLSTLKALTTVLTLYEDNFPEKKAVACQKISDQLCFSCIDHICGSLHDMVESLVPTLVASEEILDFLYTQAELLLQFVRAGQGSLSISACVIILKTSGSGLKMLRDLRSSMSGIKKTVKVLLMLFLFAVESIIAPDKESEGFAEVSNVCLSLLPILCTCITTAEHCSLSLTAIDLILRTFLTPKTWFPVIQKHLRLQHVILRLQDYDSLASLPTTLKFLLTLAHVKGGAEMLLSAGFFSSLRTLLGNLLDDRPSALITNNGFLKSSEKIEKPQGIWGIGLAVVTAMIHSLGDSCVDLMDNVIAYFFSEKAYLISYYLDAPHFPSDSHDKKRLRAQRTQTSLITLKETECTLMLMCSLANHSNLWVKAMKEMDFPLREKVIHLLAFISRGLHRPGEPSGGTAPLLCSPVLKEEFESCKKPAFLNCRNGWFALSPICCTMPKLSTVLATSVALAIKGQSSETANLVSPTYFSDLLALQIYRIAFLLLKFLCMEAEAAVKRSEEVGLIDLAHIPELPMPEILHGLQDQAVAIVSELCNGNKLKQIPAETQSVCILLLQILEMALSLELSVIQICGIRPVLGRIEDFSKEVKLLLKAMEGHVSLKVSAKSLIQIICLVYPGLLQSEDLL